MRIVIEFDTTDREQVATRPSPAATDAGGPPRELVAAVEQTAAQPGPAGRRPLDVGGPPAHLLARLGDPTSPPDRPT
jgi:hypothetical protein